MATKPGKVAKPLFLHKVIFDGGIILYFTVFKLEKVSLFYRKYLIETVCM